MDLNRVLMIGNLTRDPETRSTNSGKSVTSFTIAVNERRSGPNSEEKAMFIRVSAWDKTGELVAQYMTKGSTVLVEGRLKIEEYKAKDGTDRREPTIVADRVSFGPKPRGDGQASSGGGNYSGRSDSYGGGGGARSGGQQSYGKPAASEPEFDRSNDESNGGGTDDDLPF